MNAEIRLELRGMSPDQDLLDFSSKLAEHATKRIPLEVNLAGLPCRVALWSHGIDLGLYDQLTVTLTGAVLKEEA